MNPVSTANALSPWAPGILSLAIFALMVFLLLGLLLFILSRIGERRPTLEKGRPFESGIIPTGPPLFSFQVPFYLIALFFLIFDVETAFIFAWAAAFRLLGWIGWLRITFFIFILLISLLYVWKKGGLDWRTKI